MERLRILVTADPELPVPPLLYGGIERMVDLLVRGLQKRGHHVGLVAHVDSTCPANAFFPWPGRHSMNLLDTWRNTIALWRTIKTFQPDLIHSSSRLTYLLPCLHSARLPKVMAYNRRPSARAVRQAAWLAGSSLLFTGVSRPICRQGEEGGGTWITVHNAVDLERYTFQPQVPQDAPLIFLSHMGSIKGPHVAIAAARLARRRLILAGNHEESGLEGQYWRERIAPELGKNGIDYVGPVDDKQKNELLGQASALLVPIQWEEPFGIVFAEALACGTPVISCPRGALPEIVHNGIEGFLIQTVEEAADAISRIGTLSRAACRARAEEAFSADRMVGCYEDVYAKLLTKAVS